MVKNKSRNPSARRISKRIREGDYIFNYVHRPTELDLETDAAENCSLGVIFCPTSEFLTKEADADGREERELIRSRIHVSAYCSGPFCVRFWAHESEPGALLVESDALDAFEEDAFEGATSVDEYEAIPVSPLKHAICKGTDLWVVTWTFNPLPMYRKWKKRALAIDSDTHKSDINLAAFIHCAASQTVTLHTYVDAQYKQFMGATRLGLKTNKSIPS